MRELGPYLYPLRDYIGYLIPPFPVNQQKGKEAWELEGLRSNISPSQPKVVEAYGPTSWAQQQRARLLQNEDFKTMRSESQTTHAMAL